MDKTIPDYIIEGVISVDSREAFGSILKQFPQHPGLLKAYGDWLLKKKLKDEAAKSFSAAAACFLQTGRLMQAAVAKVRQWRLKPPDRNDILEFLSAVKTAPGNDIPADLFFKNLGTRELFAVTSAMEFICHGPGKVIQKTGDPETALFFVVSGMLKDSSFESIETKSRHLKNPNLMLRADDVFGRVFPLSGEHLSASYIETASRVELATLTRPALIRISRKHPDVEKGILQLSNIRSKNGQDANDGEVRRTQRYPLPVKMSVQMLPGTSGAAGHVLEGLSSDISIGGVSVVLNGRTDLAALQAEPSLEGGRVRVELPDEKLSIGIAGQIVRSREIVVNGNRTLKLGIQFDDMPPRLRGLFLALVESAGRAGATSTQTIVGKEAPAKTTRSVRPADEPSVFSFEET